VVGFEKTPDYRPGLLVYSPPLSGPSALGTQLVSVSDGLLLRTQQRSGNALPKSTVWSRQPTAVTSADDCKRGAFLPDLSPAPTPTPTRGLLCLCYAQQGSREQASSNAHARAIATGCKPVAMDWDAKMLPAWDLGTVVVPIGGGGGALDLKLGAPTSSRAAVATAAPTLPSANPPPPPPPPSSSAPPKRPRPGHAQQAAPACSVQGCDADLSQCRDYHRRHKVCVAHSKAPFVTVAGQQQRFCQQCSRCVRIPPPSPPHHVVSCRAAYGRTPLRAHGGRDGPSPCMFSS
jgi:hypothetical protein